MTAHILVIDEDPTQRRTLKFAIEAQGHIAHMAETQHAGIEILRRNRDVINVVLVDASSANGLPAALLSTLSEINPTIPAIVLTADGATDTALAAVRGGAFDFLVKPFAPERLMGAMQAALKIHHSSLQGKAPRRARSGAVSFSDVVSVSSAMSRVVELGRRAAQSAIPVMLEGEAGVGKELIARAIHAASDRSSKPFVSVNCNAAAASQIEEALFGAERGVPVDGDVVPGKISDADGGSLFIEEISELSAQAQIRLLELVQSGELDGGASRKSRKVNVRLILSTNKDLIEEVKAGRFREDLYYRLNVFPITIAALRRRKEDIPHLVRAFVERFSLEQRLVKTLQIDSSAIALLTAFDWPGNTRQLENAIFRAVVLAESSVLGESDFPHIASQVPTIRSAGHNHDVPVGLNEPSTMARVQAALAERTASFAAVTPPAAPAAAAGSLGNVIISTDEAGNVRKLAEIEEELIRFALKFYRGQMSQVARKLGIGRSTLYRKLKDYGIDPDDPQKHAA